MPHTPPPLVVITPGWKLGQALFAAAPDLLASLKWITEFCSEHPDWFGAEDGVEGEWLENARAAIAKAEGR